MSAFRTIKDDLHRKVSIPRHPQRIISLCPSLTSTLIALGLADRIVGRTQYCIHPAEVVAGIPVVGGTKNIKQELILELAPDLVIAEKEENTPEMVAWLEQHFPVFVTDVYDIVSALGMVGDLGVITDMHAPTGKLLREINAALLEIPRLPTPVTALYFIWRKPWMLAGKSTYIDAIMRFFKFKNLAYGLEGRYPELKPADAASLDPEVVLLSSEPFPFQDRHAAEVQAMFPKARIMRVDGEMFSWYGERMRALPEYLGALKAEWLGEGNLRG